MSEDPAIRDLDSRDMSSEGSTAEDQQSAQDEPADIDARRPEDAKSIGTLEGQIEDVKQRAREMAGEEQSGEPEVAGREERLNEPETAGGEDAGFDADLAARTEEPADPDAGRQEA